MFLLEIFPTVSNMWTVFVITKWNTERPKLQCCCVYTVQIKPLYLLKSNIVVFFVCFGFSLCMYQVNGNFRQYVCSCSGARTQGWCHTHLSVTAEQVTIPVNSCVQIKLTWIINEVCIQYTALQTSLTNVMSAFSHTHTHVFIQQWQRWPRSVPPAHQEQITHALPQLVQRQELCRAQHPAQGHYSMLNVGVGDQTHLGHSCPTQCRNWCCFWQSQACCSDENCIGHLM